MNWDDTNTLTSEAAYARWGRVQIETQHGSFSPTAPEFDIRDIAHGLSQVCRFNGQCDGFYSVAEHSVLVARIMGAISVSDAYRGLLLEGLLHDANEAYLPDVPSPYKQLLPDLRKLEMHVDAAMRLHFGLPPAKSAACTHADTLAVIIEAYDLLPSRGTGELWQPLEMYREAALQLRVDPRFRVRGLYPRQAEKEFLQMYEELKS